MSFPNVLPFSGTACSRNKHCQINLGFWKSRARWSKTEMEDWDTQALNVFKCAVYSQIMSNIPPFVVNEPIKQPFTGTDQHRLFIRVNFSFLSVFFTIKDLHFVWLNLHPFPRLAFRSIFLIKQLVGNRTSTGICPCYFPISHGIHWGFLWFSRKVSHGFPIAQELGEMNGFSQHPQQQDDLKTSGHTLYICMLCIYIYIHIYIYSVCVILIGKLNNWLSN